MPPDLPNEQELMLKKRARRRLVGAIALVLLMVIVLPQVLQDRAVLNQQEAIKITMPDAASNTGPAVDQSPAELEVNQKSSQPDNAVAEETQQTEVNASPKPSEDLASNKEAENKKPDVTPEKVQAEKKTAVKVSEPSAAPKPGVVQKQSETFTVQVGVYSDLANVKRLQDQLKQAGFSTYTEKINTPKGESIRLKAGNFTSRQDAVAALGKIKEKGLSGIVVSNE